jgi:hypothetical protein
MDGLQAIIGHSCSTKPCFGKAARRCQSKQRFVDLPVNQRQRLIRFLKPL